MKTVKNLALFSFLAAVTSAHADYVGNVGAVNQSALGTPASKASHQLKVGLGVEDNERIQTGSDGNAQIIFLDTSTMTVGHNSSVIVDQFIFNKDRNLSAQGISLTKGVLRFVGGSVSHTTGAEIKTPAASIGIRGGSVLISIDANDRTQVILQYGIASIQSALTSRTITKPGVAVIVEKNGTISQNFRPTVKVISDITTKMSSRDDQRGGVAQAPTNSDAKESLSGLPTMNIVQGNGLNEMGQMWAGNALVQSLANAANQATATGQAAIFDKILTTSSAPTPTPTPTPPPIPPTPPSPPGPPTPPTPPGPPGQ